MLCATVSNINLFLFNPGQLRLGRRECSITAIYAIYEQLDVQFAGEHLQLYTLTKRPTEQLGTDLFKTAEDWRRYKAFFMVFEAFPMLFCLSTNSFSSFHRPWGSSWFCQADSRRIDPRSWWFLEIFEDSFCLLALSDSLCGGFCTDLPFRILSYVLLLCRPIQ